MAEYAAAEQRDLPLLFALNRALIDQYEDVDSIDYDRVLAWVEKNLRKQLPHFRRILHDGQLAGFFCLSDGELDNLFVLPEYRGIGLGTEMIRYCQALSPSLTLYVFRKNVRAIALYQRMGFQITKEAGKTRYIMEWKRQDR